MVGLFLLHIAVWLVHVAARDQPWTPLRPRMGPKSWSSSPGSRKFIIEVEQTVGSVALLLHSKLTQVDPYYKAFDCRDLFSGMVLETDSEDVESLLAMDGVINAWPARTVRRPRAESSVNLSPTVARNYTVHQWTGVDKLHAKGIRGKGATIALIDTGVDFTHEALGGCFGPNCKIFGGYDLVGARWDVRYDRVGSKRPDSDPMDFEGHGTHVAGIMVAENKWLTGVAPDANLLVYKVFSDDLFQVETDDATIMQALCDAYHAGADVITTSVGEPNGFSDNPWAVLSSRLVNKGIVMVSSAGNEGYAGPFYSSSGSVGRGVLAAAAINTTIRPPWNLSEAKFPPAPAAFTSWGPTNELLIKPDIGAPGVEISSTMVNQSYASMSGTSMAAPYIAGVAALYIGEHGGRELHGPGFARMLRNRIASSGKSLPWVTNETISSFKAPPFQVGTGLVDALKVVNYDTQLEFQPFALNDVRHFRSSWTFKITNTGDKLHKYTFELEPSGGTNIYDNYYGVASLFSLKPERIAPHVTFPDRVIVPAKSTREVWVLFDPPDVDEDWLPLYGGKLWVISDHGEKLSIPYGGAGYDTEKAFDSMFTQEPYVSGSGRNWTWSFNVEKDWADFVEITARFSYPCVHLRFDIFEDGWTELQWSYPPKIGVNGYVGAATTMRRADEFWFFNPLLNDKDDTEPFPLNRIPRGFHIYWWFGKLANGTHIAPGNYTIRFAALRPHGNPQIQDHWDVMYNEARNIQILPSNETNNSTMMLSRSHTRPCKIRNSQSL